MIEILGEMRRWQDGLVAMEGRSSSHGRNRRSGFQGVGLPERKERQNFRWAPDIAVFMKAFNRPAFILYVI